MTKDWTGNKATTFVLLGASNHSSVERETNDYYCTDPESVKLFLNALKRDNFNLHNEIWECACGEGHISKVLINNGYKVFSSDLIDRGYGIQKDFLQENTLIPYQCDVLTNPPYKYAKEFVEHALELIEDNFFVAMLLKIQFLESKSRRMLFDKYPPIYIYIYSERQTCYLNGDMSKKMSSASCYAWFIWQKGNYKEPIIRWI